MKRKAYDEAGISVEDEKRAKMEKAQNITSAATSQTDRRDQQQQQQHKGDVSFARMLCHFTL